MVSAKLTTPKAASTRQQWPTLASVTPHMMSFMPATTYVMGRQGEMTWKNSGQVSSGNVPAAEASCKMSSTMAMSLPGKPNVAMMNCMRQLFTITTSSANR